MKPQSPMRDSSLSRRFRLWRISVRMIFLAGVAAPLIIQLLPDHLVTESVRAFLVVIGFVLLVITFPFYSLFCNRCPRCRRSFSEASEYEASTYTSTETSGLALFNTIAACPFCGLIFNESGGSTDRTLPVHDPNDVPTENPSGCGSGDKAGCAGPRAP